MRILAGIEMDSYDSEGLAFQQNTNIDGDIMLKTKL